uniref:small monomeric GTPase n=1 Tax=Varanus komodoensis TaxID=61221 RepID=A0A8D2Q242_VARKO
MAPAEESHAGGDGGEAQGCLHAPGLIGCLLSGSTPSSWCSWLLSLYVFPAMTMQFISHRFPDYHDPTIEDAYKTQVRIDDEPAYLDILDTAGQAEFTAMRDQYMRGGEGFIICYSITDRQSFQEASEFKELIYRVRHTYNIPLVLVGNKIDLQEFRQVSRDEGMHLAQEYSCPFFETSAALHFYIDDVFHELVREIRRREKSLPQAEGKSKSKDSLWQKLKGSLKKKRESPS